jgi:hypothetical protein
MFAEAVRLDRELKGLFGGGWQPTDRPPLMTGAHLLLGQIFEWMQMNNDGDYLVGRAFNVAAIVFSTLWAAALREFLVAGLRVCHRDANSVLLVIAILPFTIFNSTYGWPKAFASSFAIAAAVIVFEIVRDGGAPRLRRVILFGALSALALLAHASIAMFLLPLGLLLGWQCGWRRLARLLPGAFAGAALVSSWLLYQRVTLPSDDPVLRYAITGDYAERNRETSLNRLVLDFYRTTSVAEITTAKLRMLVQPLTPLATPFSLNGPNADLGQKPVDFLRGWDAKHLSGGNAGVPIAVALALVLLCRRRGVMSGHAPTPDPDVAVAALVGFVVVWLLLVSVFFAPLHLHHWPFAAVFCAAAAGLSVLHSQRPRWFRWIAATTLIYVVAVWVVAPLRIASHLDSVALAVTATFACWCTGNILCARPSSGNAAT